MTVAAFSISSWFGNNEALIQSALMAAILAYSFQIVLRSGVFSFAGVAFWAIGGYTAAILTLHGWATVPAILVALVGCAVIAYVLALVVGRLRSLYLAMATVAFDLLVQTVASTWTGLTGGAQGLYAVPLRITTLDLFLLVAACSILLWLLERGASGRMLEALRLDEGVASAVGVNVTRERRRVFVLSGVLAALAGTMNPLLFSTIGPSQAGFELITATLTMIVIGGVASWPGALVGAFIVTWLPGELTFLGNWWPAVQGLLVIVVVIYFSDGLVGLVVSLWRGLQELVRRRSLVAMRGAVRR